MLRPRRSLRRLPWTDAQLSAPAGDNWLEYYGSLTGDRYSSLNQITTSNVSTLKEVWHMSLGTCTAGLIAGNPVIPGAPKGATNNPTNCGSMESNPVAVDGVLYTTNAPLGSVFAIDAATGPRSGAGRPSYAGETLNNGSAFTPGSGGRRPGVAVGEGLVFDGLPDGRLVALNQVTGTAGVGDRGRVVQEQREDLERPDLRQRHGPRR